MRLEKEEKNIVEKITTLSSVKDPTIVKNILECLFVTISSQYSNGETINVPYLGEIEVVTKRKIIDGKPDVLVYLNLTPSKIMTEEIKCIKNEVTPPSDEIFKNLISIEIENILDIDSDVDFI